MSEKDNVFRQELVEIRRHIEELRLPTNVYAAIGIGEHEYFIAIVDGDDTVMLKEKRQTDNQHQEVINTLQKYTQTNNIKIIAAAIVGAEHPEVLASRLWLEEDIVPYVQLKIEGLNEARVQEAAQRVATYFDPNYLVNVQLTEAREVRTSFLVTLDEYKKTVPPQAWSYLETLVQEFHDLHNHLLFFNATPQGGGVALMRHGLIRFLRLLGVDSHWHVLEPNRHVFEITKTKFHNVLQAVSPEEVELTEQDKQMYTTWINENAGAFEEIFRRAKVVVIDDPQPSGMIPAIAASNPNARTIYRSHIHLDRDLLEKPGTPQQHTWEFLWENIKHADAFISHPVEKFIPHTAAAMTLTMPATTDPLDGLNKSLTQQQITHYLNLFNKILLEHDQQPLDPARPYIIQIARFDPSKGIPDVIESYRQLREKLGDKVKPQLVLAGHGSIDDPDGIPVYNMTLHLLQSQQYQHLLEDVKIVRLHHNDQILNALLRGSKVALQLSHREGFEVKVSEALHKGRPVIAFKAGGIPLQIRHGENGFLVDVGDCATVAEHLYQLFTDSALYERLSNEALRNGNPHYFTVYNAIKWLYLANALVKKEKLPGDGQSVEDLLAL